MLRGSVLLALGAAGLLCPSSAAMNSSALMALEPERVNVAGRVNYFQAPAAPKGLVAVFPGCDRTGYGFWPNSAACPECCGMPEDVASTKQFLARGYGVLVLTAGGPSLCWTHATDQDFIQKVLPEFLAKHPQFKDKPLYTWCASSGGGITQRNLGNLGVKVHGVMAVVATSADIPSIVKGAKGHYPPIVWITMSAQKEIDTAKQHVADYSKYAPAAMATAGVKKITPSFFSDRCPPLTPEQSAKMVAFLERDGVIAADGALKVDPKADRAWLAKITATFPFLKDSKDFQTAPFQKAALLQELLVAQAHHEHVTDYTTAMLEWLESGGEAKFAPLARECEVVKPAALPGGAAFAGSCPNGAASGEEAVVVV